MADEIDISRADLSQHEQIVLLVSSVGQWNAWRKRHDIKEPVLSSADLGEVDLAEANLAGADLRGAFMIEANMCNADLRGANLRRANMSGADLEEADLRGANLTDAHLGGANLISANLAGADLTGANLSLATLAHASLVNATLDGCTVFGVSVWNVRLDGATQSNLCITGWGEPQITVDDLRVAQFLYLLLNNQEIRAVLDTIASKVVFVLGRFSVERKPALDALRSALRSHPNGYIPVLFEYTSQAQKPILETVKTLASLARFIVVDLTDPNMVSSEITAITTSVPTVPIQPLIEGEAPLPTEIDAWAAHRSFLPIYRYRDIPHLIAALDEAVITPVEQFVRPRPIVERPSS